MGLIQPMIIGLKILIQHICKEKLDWDEMLSQKLLKDWHDCWTKLEKMGSIETHCRFEIGNSTNPAAKRELHCMKSVQTRSIFWAVFSRIRIWTLFTQCCTVFAMPVRTVTRFVFMLKLFTNQGKYQSNYYR